MTVRGKAATLLLYRWRSSTRYRRATPANVSVVCGRQFRLGSARTADPLAACEFMGRPEVGHAWRRPGHLKALLSDGPRAFEASRQLVRTMAAKKESSLVLGCPPDVP
eukprot:CAMPEP_0179286974 /NCGR_PEP_ID=MMETSP0797-20121207/40026_1 /TAXON_ID=47934 /ORGANISM="Dinophysis acuminata, Strain DAEP01" /LENGTH=107 /DNA_ID=CAMNT_0020995891 /DNA_START=40 /DNA_END=363 /DNA_ORIENTATION=+